MKKVVLILHGYPRIDSKSLLFKLFRVNNYKIFCPNLISKSFSFTLPEITKNILTILNSNSPDFIVGVSLGGLILPSIALHYPKAKLIFVASSVSANPKSIVFKSLLDILAASKLLNFATKLPNSLLSSLYSIFNPFYGDKKDRPDYEKDKMLNLKAIKTILVDKHQEIIRFIVSTDNSSTLPKLKQPTLILSSNNDTLTPAIEGEKLHKLLKNSKIIKTNGGHFEVIRTSTIKEVENFLDIRSFL